MNAPAKFLFEDDFAANAKPAKPMVSLAAHQSALARAEEDGYRRGAAAAEAPEEYERGGPRQERDEERCVDDEVVESIDLHREGRCLLGEEQDVPEQLVHARVSSRFQSTPSSIARPAKTITQP